MEKAIVLGSCLLLFSLWELGKPFFPYPKSHWKRRVANLVVAGFNGGMGLAFFSALTFWVMDFRPGWGLLPALQLAPWATLTLSLLALDLWMYIWHLLNHRVRFLWRFHKAHHSDTEMDATTALRFHPVEIVLSYLIRLPVFFVLGLSPLHLLVYDLILTGFTMFSHANISVGSPLDRGLRLVFVTPYMHKVHHSTSRREYNSNYSSVLSVWDRIFKSYTHHPLPQNIKLGLPRYRHPSWQDVPGIIASGFMADPNGSARTEKKAESTRSSQ